MKKIKFMLEYRCLPIWLYAEDGHLIGNAYPEELKDNAGFTEQIAVICREFDALYKDDAEGFEFVGFKDEALKSAFFKKVDAVYSLLVRTIGKKYLVVKEFSDIKDY